MTQNPPAKSGLVVVLGLASGINPKDGRFTLRTYSGRELAVRFRGDLGGIPGLDVGNVRVTGTEFGGGPSEFDAEAVEVVGLPPEPVPGLGPTHPARMPPRLLPAEEVAPWPPIDYYRPATPAHRSIVGTVIDAVPAERRFTLKTYSGQFVPVQFDGPVAGLVGRNATVWGPCDTDSDGEVTLLRADQVGASRRPAPVGPNPDEVAAAIARADRERVIAEGGDPSIFGKWPGDETDEEIEQLLKDIG